MMPLKSSKSLEILAISSYNMNCYIVYHKLTRKCFIINPFDQADNIVNTIAANNLIPQFIIVTYPMLENIPSINALLRKYNIVLLTSHTDVCTLLNQYFMGKELQCCLPDLRDEAPKA